MSKKEDQEATTWTINDTVDVSEAGSDTVDALLSYHQANVHNHSIIPQKFVYTKMERLKDELLSGLDDGVYDIEEVKDLLKVVGKRVFKKEMKEFLKKD